MAKVHTIHAAKTQLSRLIARAVRGEEVVIARGSQALVKLVALDDAGPKRQFGAMRGRARVTKAFFDPLPDDELSAITVVQAQRAGSLNIAHRDPFDRVLIAQAQMEDLAIVSNETIFDGLGVTRIW